MKDVKKLIKKIGIENLISVVGHVLTIMSLILVFFTLQEMTIQRNNTYMPQIVAECNDVINMSWNKIQDITLLKSDDNSKNKQMTLEFYNVGVGVARNLKFEWVNDNMETLSEYINGNSSNFQTSIDNGRFIIKTNGIETGGTEVEDINKINFIAPNNSESYKIDIPYQYLLFYKVMLVDMLDDYPPIYLKISYTDIQAKEYEQILTITIEPTTLISMSGSEDEDYIGNVELRVNTY